jgi:hypothetical protein
VRKVLQKLKEKDLPVKLSKCEFHKHEIKFLGFLVSDQGLAPNPDKIQLIQEWPTPACVKDVQSFLGIANYYRKFIEGFSGIAGSLTNLIKKDVPFE